MSDILVLHGQPGNGIKVAEYDSATLDSLWDRTDFSDLAYLLILDTDGTVSLFPHECPFGPVTLSSLTEEDLSEVRSFLKEYGDHSDHSDYVGIYLVTSVAYEVTKDYKQINDFDEDTKEFTFVEEFYLDEDGCVYVHDDFLHIPNSPTLLTQWVGFKNGELSDYAPDAPHQLYLGDFFYVCRGEDGYISLPRCILEQIRQHFVLVSDAVPPQPPGCDDPSLTDIQVLSGEPGKPFVTQYVSGSYLRDRKLEHRDFSVLFTLYNRQGSLVLVDMFGTDINLNFLPETDQSTLLALCDSNNPLVVVLSAYFSPCDESGHGTEHFGISAKLSNSTPSFEQGESQVIILQSTSPDEVPSRPLGYYLQSGDAILYLYGGGRFHSAPQSLLHFISQAISVVKA